MGCQTWKKPATAGTVRRLQEVEQLGSSSVRSLVHRDADRKCQAIVGFDYSSLGPSAATLAMDAANKIRGHQRRAVTEIFDIGATLTRVKEVLGHGRFGPWLIAEFGWSERSAQRYMQVASLLGAKSDTVSYLPPTLIYRLARPSTPAQVRDDIVRQIEGGVQLSPSSIKDCIDEARSKEREAQFEASLTERQRKRRAKRRKEHENWRREEEARREKEGAEAKAMAEKLIEEVGLPTIKRVLDAIGANWRLQSALEAAISGGSN